jgi:hypothetical protein
MTQSNFQLPNPLSKHSTVSQTRVQKPSTVLQEHSAHQNQLFNLAKHAKALHTLRQTYSLERRSFL